MNESVPLIYLLKFLQKQKWSWYFNYRIKNKEKAVVWFDFKYETYFIQLVFPVNNVLSYKIGKASFSLKDFIKTYNKTKNYEKAFTEALCCAEVCSYVFEDYEILNRNTQDFFEVKKHFGNIFVFEDEIEIDSWKFGVLKLYNIKTIKTEQLIKGYMVVDFWR